MSEDYNVRWFREEDLPAFIDGLNSELWDEYDEKVYEWKFRKDPFNIGFTPIVVVEHKPTGEKVAFNSFLPLQIRRGRDVFLALQGCDGFVQREHRRRGLFQSTLKFLLKEMKGRSPEILIGFNLAEAAGAARKAGSESAFFLNKFLADASTLKEHAHESHIKLKTIDLLKYHELYESWAARSMMIHIHRTLSYLIWRVQRHPVRKSHPYRVMVNKETVGYVVVDIVEENKSLTMTINDYTPKMLEKHFPEILSRLLEKYPDADTVEFVAIDRSRLAFKALENGFKPLPWYDVIMMALDNTYQEKGSIFRGGLKVSDGRKWFITSSDIY
ncbi:MAG: hypothetical protein ACUVV4_05370 [Candidatus Bathyarchaeia archaeon]